MHVLFVEPFFPSYQQKFVHALVKVGARVTGIGETPFEYLPGGLREKLHHYERVTNVTDEKQLFHAVRRCQKREWVDLLESTIEAHILPVAKVRQACSIPGTKVRTAFLCRDKPAMKDALRRAGIPCAASTGASSVKEVVDFVKSVGYPIIIKPTDAAGAAGTYKVANAQQLEAALIGSRVKDGVRVAVEEYLEGHEGFYDTISIGGQIGHEFGSHYYPNVLHGMRTRWISPQVLTTNRIEGPGYEDIKEMGDKVNRALGIDTSATHMEWFRTPKGLRFSEIGCRPPGVGMWDVYSFSNDFDIYEEWAMAVVHRRIGKRPSRRFSGGMIAMRPSCDGYITGYDGLEYVQRRYANNIVDYHIPPVGAPTQPVEAGFWANAWMRTRHSDYDGLRAMMNDIGEKVQVHAR